MRIVVGFLSVGMIIGVTMAEKVNNPYEGVNWESVESIHSFSHQHVSIKSLEDMWRMGYRHLPISNYYPSRPVYPLPESFTDKYPGALGAPNAEQHSLLDMPIHYNIVGSHFDTGYGKTPSVDRSKSPITEEFDGLNVFDAEDRPWQGIYRLDLRFEAVDKEADENPGVKVSVSGAVESALDYSPADTGAVIIDSPRDMSSPGSMTLKTIEPTLKVRLEFDPAVTKITQFRLMQGSNRYWKEAFRAALDGDSRNESGKRVEGLLFEDGGGVTINHPGISVAQVCELLDFDPRVLGIEVWNQHNFFGGTTVEAAARDMGFYTLWDKVLRTGRRCYGFFVKDHCMYGRGRNVLLMEPGGTVEERERKALRAYRNGEFFGLIGAMSVNEEGEPVQPYDFTRFRFTRIAVRRENGSPVGVEFAVDGADEQLRPNVQFRVVTDAGVALTGKGKTGYFALPRDAQGEPTCMYVRLEAFAYPDEAGGEALSHEKLEKMSVFEISRLHDFRGDSGTIYMDAGKGTPLGVVDMLFSQPVLFDGGK